MSHSVVNNASDPQGDAMYPVAATEVSVSRPKITLLMVLCGVISATAAGAVSAAAVSDDVPRLVVKFDPESLATDSGARALYRRLVNAAAQVCPDTTGSHLGSSAVQHCRAQAVARAVHQIDNPRLAALSAGSAKRG
jgi:UrcA family protein